MRRLIGIVGASFLGVSAAIAQTEVATFAQNGMQALTSGGTSHTYGYEFTVGASPITVTGLADYVGSVPVSSSTADIGLWNSSGTLLASAIITTGNSKETADDLFYTLPVSVNLQPGATYYVGSFVLLNAGGGQGSEYLKALNGSIGSAFSDITVNSAATANSSTLTDPTLLVGGGTSGYSFGANIMVPDAGSSLLLLSMGLTGLAAFGRKKLR